MLKSASQEVENEWFEYSFDLCRFVGSRDDRYHDERAFAGTCGDSSRTGCPPRGGSGLEVRERFCP